MFRLFQTDPASGALYIDTASIARHPLGEQYAFLLSEFIKGNVSDYISIVRESDDVQANSRILFLLINYLHELRHSIDLILTPAGFYQIRAAMEFSEHFHRLSTEFGELPVPLMSGLDEVNQKILGLENFSSSSGYWIASSVANRYNIVRRDNTVHVAGNGRTVSFGANQILEGLAGGFQAEVLNALFDEPYAREKFPGFYNSESENEHIRDLQDKYLWPYGIVSQLGQTPDAVRLVFCILLASLCGAMGPSREKIKVLSPDELQYSNKRYLDKELPNHRFIELVRAFQRDGVPSGSWEEIWSAVDDKVEDIWGKKTADFIEADIETDAGFVEISLKLGDVECESGLMRPVHAYSDLVRQRRKLLEIFKEQPTAFVSPVEFLSKVTSQFIPPVVYTHAAGEFIADPEKKEWCLATQKTAIERGPSEEIDFSLVAVDCVDRKCSTVRSENRESWVSYLAMSVPIYKLMLYGYHYKPMLGADLFQAEWAVENVFNIKICWDPIFKRANDFSNSAAYFEFYELLVAECDLCARHTDRERAKIVSSLTLRQNKNFVEGFCAQRSGIEAYLMLSRDWSDWLLCEKCISEWELMPVPSAVRRKAREPMLDKLQGWFRKPRRRTL